MTIVPFRKPGDKRRYRRLAAHKSAEVHVKETGQRIAVQITDLSAGGARLELSKPLQLPQTFSLIRDAETPQAAKIVNCRLRWQRGRNLGVSFF